MSSRAAEKILGRFSFVFLPIYATGRDFFAFVVKFFNSTAFYSSKKNCSVFIHDLKRVN